MAYTKAMLALHVVIALASLVAAGYVLARPSQNILHLNYSLIASTIMSGVALVFFGYSAIHICVAGIIYSTIAVAMATLAQKRLASSGA